jgi:hypothetical protein
MTQECSSLSASLIGWLSKLVNGPAGSFRKPDVSDGSTPAGSHHLLHGHFGREAIPPRYCVSAHSLYAAARSSASISGPVARPVGGQDERSHDLDAVNRQRERMSLPYCVRWAG